MEALSSAETGGKPANRLSKQRLRDTLRVGLDHPPLLNLTLLDPTRVQEHHCTGLVPLIAIPRKASQLTLEAKRLRDTFRVGLDHNPLLNLTFLDPTRVQEHHCIDLVPLIAIPHVVLSLGSSQLS